MLMEQYELMGNTLALQYGGSDAHSVFFQRQKGEWEASTRGKVSRSYPALARVPARRRDGDGQLQCSIVRAAPVLAGPACVATPAPVSGVVHTFLHAASAPAGGCL